ncbi:D-2-hydroxyacid dehydrogenase [Streptantibioticus ferralitis]|uniref:D-2-hydroxyacid dehydrogenase n=1 Tax=Streptantibioticus ferralitis TaxID=236510 RepID=A0ABT5YX05_9ACTN|nr:D-2-hydroxyacid dehydrogenase [Streptantibioticus ferralitis]MDF2255375.1 D-2-hydroxyacid dehydrogenase [Streptantibioticus ferralitis]
MGGISTVLVLGDQPPRQLDLLGPAARIMRAEPTRLRDQLAAADVVLVWDFTSDAVRDAWPERGRVPAWVHTASAGVDRLVFPALIASRTVLTNARGVFEQPIAEYVAGLVLAMAKDFQGTWELQRQRRWRHRETMRVAGSQAVVVGAGPIGRAVGSTLAALGIQVALVGRTGRDGDPDFGRVRCRVELPVLLAEADWVVCAAPLTEETRGMFDAAAFDRMKASARFINVGRGPLVVADDLVRALLARRITGAVLDVFDDEPLPHDHRLWDVPGLLISPHMSGDTFGWRDELAEQFLDNFARWTAGRPLLNVVDKQLGYVPVGQASGGPDD